MRCRAGADGTRCVFLFSDTQLKSEAFVEDLHNLLNAGEVPGLFPYDERAGILETCRTASARAGLSLETPAELWAYFVDCTKANLHIVLCFSPIGDAFRCACSHAVCSANLATAISLYAQPYYALPLVN